MRLQNLFRAAVKAHQQKRFRPQLETLEDRMAPATFFVTNINDSGAGSLRQAIISANQASGTDTINFSIGAGAKTITPATALPTITGPTIIAGNTQPGFTTTPLIEINGPGAGTGVNGLVLKGAGCVVRGLVINDFQGNGILVYGSNSVVEGCFIGTNAAGAAGAVGNNAHGVLIAGAATGVRIGGTTAAARNVISGNTLSGVAILGALTSGNKIQGNFIGTNSGGAADVGNSGDGVLIAGGSDNNVIGGTVTGAGNVISGNTFTGVTISDAGTTGNKVQGNRIGTNSVGTGDLGNGLAGVTIALGAASNTIGGTVAGARNVISGNGSNGIEIRDTGTKSNLIQGNFIGTDVNGTADLGNTLSGVLILNKAANNTVGGTVAGSRNVLSGNGSQGVFIRDAGTTGNKVQGNFIGLSAAGAALGNSGRGVSITSGAANNLIGGTVAAAGNVISANNDGVLLSDAGTTGNLVQGNFIGTDPAGALDFGNTFDGVFILLGASNNTIGGTVAGARNVISGNNLIGVEVRDGVTTGNLIQGNFIGTNATGNAPIGNNLGGVVLLLGTKNNTVGGAVTAARNVISGNTVRGVWVRDPGTTGNKVLGNFIGTNAAGTADLGNGSDGVEIALTATNNTIGGTTTAARNVISGNNRFGILVQNTGTTGNLIRGNFVGLSAAGAALGNTSHGIFVTFAAANNTIGGTIAGAGNVIAHNGSDGVLIGNDASLGFNNAAGSGNAVQRNRIFNNSGQGIDLGANDGITTNDADDPDSGPNELLNTPTLTSAFLLGTTLSLSGFVNTETNKVLTIEFFANATGGQGQTFLGSLNISMGAKNTVIFTTTLTVPATVLAGHKLTATMTDELGNTSEFSIPLTIE